MRTWVCLKCLDHDPELWAEGESGQHLYDLPDIRADVANRDILVAAAGAGAWPSEPFRANTVRFLVNHPKCRIGIGDEYGHEHPVTAAGTLQLPVRTKP